MSLSQRGQTHSSSQKLDSTTTQSKYRLHASLLALTYLRSIGFSEECLGLHYGDIHQAHLGDGDGRKDEEFLARQYYFPVWGTCWESLAGGNHFRAWHQNGSDANTGAWFIGYVLPSVMIHS